MAKNKGKKKPKGGPRASEDLRQEKRPISGPLPKGFYPSWRFNLADHGGPWPWTMTPEKQAEVLTKMGQWEKMKEAELIGGKKKAKRIPLPHLCKQARARLEDLELDDLDGLWEEVVPKLVEL